MESEAQVRAIHQLYYWSRNPGGTNFSAALFNLFQKADPCNKEKLAMAYPEYANALERWMLAGNAGEDLFAQYGLIQQDNGTSV